MRNNMRNKMSLIMLLIVSATYIYSCVQGRTVPEKVIPEESIYESETTTVSAVSKVLPEETVYESEPETAFQISEIETNRYTFKRADHLDALKQSQKLEEQYGSVNEAYICSLFDKEGIFYYTEADCALILGKVWALFGEPDDPDLYDYFFSYIVSVEDRDGNIMYLEIYQASGTPSIGGPVGENFGEFEEAAEELKKLISYMKPVDYEWSGIYEDFDVGITYYVKNGVAGYEDTLSKALEEYYNKIESENLYE